MPPLPHLKRWCLVCIAPTLSGAETKKKIQTSLSLIAPAMQASCTPNMKVSTQILRPINFVRLANQTGGILHRPPTPTQGGSSPSTLVMTTSLRVNLGSHHYFVGSYLDVLLLLQNIAFFPYFSRLLLP